MRHQRHHKQRTGGPVTAAGIRHRVTLLGLKPAQAPALRPGPVLSAYNYGYSAGYNDRHMARAIEHFACEHESIGYAKWLAGWREGQKHRRRDFPAEAMRYEPRWPAPLLPPPSDPIAQKKGTVYNEGNNKASRSGSVVVPLGR